MMPPRDDVGQQITVFREWIPEAGKTQKVVDAFEPLVHFTGGEQPDFNCLFILREVPDPRGDVRDDGKGIVMTLASFENKIAYQQYLLSPAMLSVKVELETSSSLQPHAKDMAVRAVAGFPYRAEHQFVPESFVVIATLKYLPGTRSQGIEGFRKVAEYTKAEEEQAYSYWFLEDAEDENVLYTFERYESSEFLWDVHAKSDAVKRNIEVQKDIRESLSFRFWRQVGASCNSKKL